MATTTDLGDDTDTTDASSYAASFTPAVGDLMVLCVGATGTVHPTSAAAVTDTQPGGRWELVTGALRSGSASSAWIFVRTSRVASAVAHAVTFTCAGDAATGCEMTCIGVQGMTRFGLRAVRNPAIASNQGAAGTPAITFPAPVLSQNPVVAIVSAAANPPAITPPTSFTERSDIGGATPTRGIEVVTRDSGHTSATVTWGSTSAGAFCVVGVELNASPPNIVAQNFQDPAVMAVKDAWRRRPRFGIVVPKLWLPEGATI